MPEDGQRPGGGRRDAADHPHRRGLAGAVRARGSRTPRPAGSRIDAVNGREVAEPLHQPPGADHHIAGLWHRGHASGGRRHPASRFRRPVETDGTVAIVGTAGDAGPRRHGRSARAVGGVSEDGPMPGVLDAFSPATRAWFEGAFAAATPAQVGAWEAIRAGRPRLGGGADRLRQDAGRLPVGAGPAGLDAAAGRPQRRCRVLYVSPMKALAVDVERNLRAPLTGVRHAAVRLGEPEPQIQVGGAFRRHHAAERRALPARRRTS